MKTALAIQILRRIGPYDLARLEVESFQQQVFQAWTAISLLLHTLESGRNDLERHLCRAEF